MNSQPDSGALEKVFRACWWPAVAAVTRQVGDLEVAEDAVQDACAAALAQWPAEGLPASPRGWLIGTARHKALDRLRRDRRRADKEAAAMHEEPPAPAAGPHGWAAGTDDELALIFTCRSGTSPARNCCAAWAAAPRRSRPTRRRSRWRRPRRNATTWPAGCGTGSAV